MNLISLDDIKNYLNITGSSLDNILTSFANDVEAEAESYCGQNIHPALTTIHIEGCGESEYILPKQPVVSINQITYRDATAINAASTTLSTTSYELRENSGVSYIYNQDSFIKGYYYTIGYMQGYSTVPLDVQKTIIEMAATMFKESNKGGSKLNLNSETQNYPSGTSGSTSYKNMWATKWKDALRKYRKMPL